MQTKYLTDEQINEMSDAIVSALEVGSIGYARKLQIAEEHARDEFGIRPSRSAVRLAAKLAGIQWDEQRLQTKRLIEG